MGKFGRQQTNDIFSYFSYEIGYVILHANWRQFAWNVKSYFPGEIFQNVCWIFYPACSVIRSISDTPNRNQLYDKSDQCRPSTAWSDQQANSADDKLMIFSYFTQKTGFDISCKFSPMETTCMKCQNLFFGKNKKICCLLKTLPRELSNNTQSSSFTHCLQQQTLIRPKGLSAWSGSLFRHFPYLAFMPNMRLSRKKWKPGKMNKTWPHQAKKYLRTCAKCADSDHPTHVHDSVSWQWRPWSDCTNV